MIEPRATLRLQFHAGFTSTMPRPGWTISPTWASAISTPRRCSARGPAPATATTWSTRPGSIRTGGEPALLRLIQVAATRHGPAHGHSAEPHGHRRRRQSLGGRTCSGARVPPRVFRHPVGIPRRRVARPGAAAVPAQRLRRGPGCRGDRPEPDREAGRLLASHGEQRASGRAATRSCWKTAASRACQPWPAVSASAGRTARPCARCSVNWRLRSPRAPRAALQRTLGELQERHEEARQRLHRLLEAQHYRLASWRTAADDINWRRFFDISELVGLRVERGEVFEAVHGKVFQLLEDGRCSMACASITSTAGRSARLLPTPRAAAASGSAPIGGGAPMLLYC